MHKLKTSLEKEKETLMVPLLTKALESLKLGIDVQLRGGAQVAAAGAHPGVRRIHVDQGDLTLMRGSQPNLSGPSIGCGVG